LNSRSLITYGVTTRLFGKYSDLPQSEKDSDTANNELSSADSTVGPLHEQPVAEEAGRQGASIVRGDTSSRELAQLTVQQAYDTSHQVGEGSNISDIEGILNVYPTTIASLSSQLDYSPRSDSGISYANVFMNVQPPRSNT
jgi:hypothetical protein